MRHPMVRDALGIAAVIAVVMGFLILIGGVAGAATPTVVRVPTAINSTCTKDVSHTLTTWLQNLPAHSTVKAKPKACYEVQHGIRLTNAQELTISGGTWKDPSVPKKNAAPKHSPLPIFWFVGGTDVTVTGATIVGTHTGGYDYSSAFEAGIRSDGVRNFDAQHDTITGVGGDGVELNVLRGAQDDSGQILAPTVNAWVQHDTITEAGRQGITMSGVRGAYVGPSVALKDIGINDFDLEADQTNEGAKNVTINGCTADGGGSLLANGGAGSSAGTGTVTMENCVMQVKQGGDAILVQNLKGSTTARGPFLFKHDTLRCGASVYVGCIQLTGANVTISASKLISPNGTVLPTQYKAQAGTSLTLSGTTFVGKFKPGKTDAESKVTS